MKKRTLSILVGLLATALLALWGCAKSGDVSSSRDSRDPAGTAAADSAAADRAREEAAAAARAQETEERERSRAAAGGLHPVYFDFDQSHIRGDAASVMKANAAWLKANPKTGVQIEGHCDERGTIEYNQALGQRRAQSAKKYLVNLGIAAGRITLISYGKENPVCRDSADACWQQNRRADFAALNR
jgi:peptidoglycan-associated lipoprotein